MAAAEIITIDESFSIAGDPNSKRIDSLMDKWCKELKANVVSEFFQVQTSFEKRQKTFVQEIQSKTSPEVIKLRREMENLRELLHTLEKSVSQKDKLVTNLVKALEKEKDKYEKLRAVSSDRLEVGFQGSCDKTDIAEKQHRKKLLSKCWFAWRDYARNKEDCSEPPDMQQPVEVKIEDDINSEEGQPIMDSLPTLEEATDNQEAHLSVPDYDGALYPYKTSMENQTSFQPAPSFSRLPSSTMTHDIPAHTTDDSIITVRPGPASQHQPSNRPQMKSGIGMNIRNSDKWKRKLRDKATYERGKKAYGMAKKKQLKGARDHFSVADGRPTMAINVFEMSQQEHRDHMANPMSGMPDGNFQQNMNNANINNQYLIQNDQYLNRNPDEAKMNPNPHSSAMDVNTRLGGNDAGNWEATAKNNISQYVNQIMEHNENTADENNWQMQPQSFAAMSMPGSAAVMATKDEQASTSRVSSEGQAQPQQQQDGPRRPFKCPRCRKEFQDFISRSRHIKVCKKSARSRKKYKCDECGRSFGSVTYLNSHKLAIHEGEPPFSCHFCKKGFITSVILDNHLRTHTGDKPFSCPICERSFAQKSTLIKHGRTHDVSI